MAPCPDLSNPLLSESTLGDDLLPSFATPQLRKQSSLALLASSFPAQALSSVSFHSLPENDSCASPPSFDAVPVSVPFPLRWKRWVKEHHQYMPSVFLWLSEYNAKKLFMNDLLAGLTVGSLLIPQGIIYSSLANLPPVNGLLSCIFPLLVYFCLGSSRHLNVGPEVSTSILIGRTVIEAAASTLPIFADVTDIYIQQMYFVPVAMALSLLVGLILLLFSFFRLGFLDSILSMPMLCGFLNGVALILIAEQSSTMLGVVIPEPSSSPAASFWYTVNHFDNAHVLTTFLSLLAIIVMISVSRYKSHHSDNRWISCFPDVLILITVGTFVSWLFDFPKRGVSMLSIGNVGFQAPSLPSYQTMFANSLLPSSALTIALLGFVESQLIAKKVANDHNYTIASNRELLALGASSVIGSIFGAYSAFGSITRTRVSEAANCQSNMANLVAAIVAILSLLFIMPIFAFTPRALTASVILVVAFNLIDIGEIKFMLRVAAHQDLAMMLAMTFITFFLGVDSGLLFAFVSCLLVAVKKTTVPAVSLLGRGSSRDGFSNLSDLNAGTNSDIEGMLLFSVKGALYFANAQKLRDSTRTLELQCSLNTSAQAALTVTTIVFDLEFLNSVDTSALAVLTEIVHSYRNKNRHVILVSLPDFLRKNFDLAGISELIGEECYFKTLPDALNFLRQSHITA